MKFEINVKNNKKLQKLALAVKMAHILGIKLFTAKVSIADRIFELLECGAESASLVVDTEITKMEPLFSIQKDMPLFQDEELGITIKLASQSESLNLCELLKNCIGMKFYMPHFGEVTLDSIAELGTVMKFYDSKSNPHIVLKNGQSSTGEEVCVFHSKEQRDWSLFVPPWAPKEGERVWVRDDINDLWVGRYFVKMNENTKEFDCIPDNKKQWIPTPYKICVPFEPIPW